MTQSGIVFDALLASVQKAADFNREKEKKRRKGTQLFLNG